MRELAHTFHSFTSNLCVCTDKGNFTNSVMLLCLYIELPSLESSNFASSFLSQRIVHKLEEHVDHMGLGLLGILIKAKAYTPNRGWTGPTGLRRRSRGASPHFCFSSSSFVLPLLFLFLLLHLCSNL